jgi:hypothetical protein
VGAAEGVAEGVAAEPVATEVDVRTLVAVLDVTFA